jgi:hypothetical protein
MEELFVSWTLKPNRLIGLNLYVPKQKFHVFSEVFPPDICMRLLAADTVQN